MDCRIKSGNDDRKAGVGWTKARAALPTKTTELSGRFSGSDAIADQNL
jgi:hypothetical protein